MILNDFLHIGKVQSVPSLHLSPFLTLFHLLFGLFWSYPWQIIVGFSFDNIYVCFLGYRFNDTVRHLNSWIGQFKAALIWEEHQHPPEGVMLTYNDFYGHVLKFNSPEKFIIWWIDEELSTEIGY